MFSPTLLSLFYYFYIIIIVFIVFTLIRYYCYYYFHRAPWLCVMGAWAGAGCGGRGLVAGLRVGLAVGCSWYLGLGSAAPAPGFLGTQPQYATQVLTY